MIILREALKKIIQFWPAKWTNPFLAWLGISALLLSFQNCENFNSQALDFNETSSLAGPVLEHYSFK